MRIKRDKMLKRGQITLFLIIALIMIISLGAGLYVLLGSGQDNITKPSLATTMSLEAASNSMRSYVQICLEKSTHEAIDNYGIKMPESEPYIERYINESVLDCVDFAFFQKKGFIVEREELVTDVRITEDAVLVSLEFPITLSNRDGENIAEMSSFEYNMQKQNRAVPNSDGIFLKETKIVSDDGDAEIAIPAGTRVYLKDGSPVSELSLKMEDKNLDGLSNKVVIGSTIYMGSPDGVWFEPYPLAKLTIEYADVPNNVRISNLKCAYYDEEADIWRTYETLKQRDNGIGEQTYTITCRVHHFSLIAVVQCGSPETTYNAQTQEFSYPPMFIHPVEPVDNGPWVGNHPIKGGDDLNKGIHLEGMTGTCDNRRGEGDRIVQIYTGNTIGEQGTRTEYDADEYPGYCGDYLLQDWDNDDNPLNSNAEYFSYSYPPAVSSESLDNACYAACSVPPGGLVSGDGIIDEPGATLSCSVSTIPPNFVPGQQVDYEITGCTGKNPATLMTYGYFRTNGDLIMDVGYEGFTSALEANLLLGGYGEVELEMEESGDSCVTAQFTPLELPDYVTPGAIDFPNAEIFVQSIVGDEVAVVSKQEEQKPVTLTQESYLALGIDPAVASESCSENCIWTINDPLTEEAAEETYGKLRGGINYLRAYANNLADKTPDPMYWVGGQLRFIGIGLTKANEDYGQKCWCIKSGETQYTGCAFYDYNNPPYDDNPGDASIWVMMKLTNEGKCEAPDFGLGLGGGTPVYPNCTAESPNPGNPAPPGELPTFCSEEQRPKFYKCEVPLSCVLAEELYGEKGCMDDVYDCHFCNDIDPTKVCCAQMKRVEGCNSTLGCVPKQQCSDAGGIELTGGNEGCNAFEEGRVCCEAFILIEECPTEPGCTTPDFCKEPYIVNNEGTAGCRSKIAGNTVCCATLNLTTECKATPGCVNETECGEGKTILESATCEAGKVCCKNVTKVEGCDTDLGCINEKGRCEAEGGTIFIDGNAACQEHFESCDSVCCKTIVSTDTCKTDLGCVNVTGCTGDNLITVPLGNDGCKTKLSNPDAVCCKAIHKTDKCQSFPGCVNESECKAVGDKILGVGKLSCESKLGSNDAVCCSNSASQITCAGVGGSCKTDGVCTEEGLTNLGQKDCEEGTICCGEEIDQPLCIDESGVCSDQSSLIDAEKEIKIMCVGDSNTWGVGNPDTSKDPETTIGYRMQLKSLLDSKEFKTDFVGSQEQGCGWFSDCQHEGYGGRGINKIQERVNEGMLETYQPDIMVLLIGSNDMWVSLDDRRPISTSEAQAWVGRLDSLLQDMTNRKPEMHIIVAKPATPTNGGLALSTYRAGIDTIVSRLCSEGRNIHLVDFNGCANDGTHYTPSGFNCIASKLADKIPCLVS